MEELRRWREEQGFDEEHIRCCQRVISEAQLALLSALFYGGRADPAFERRGADEVARVFSLAGFSGDDFWRL